MRIRQEPSDVPGETAHIALGPRLLPLHTVGFPGRARQPLTWSKHQLFVRMRLTARKYSDNPDGSTNQGRNLRRKRRYTRTIVAKQENVLQHFLLAIPGLPQGLGRQARFYHFALIPVIFPPLS